MKENKYAIFAMTSVCVILGVIIGVQIKTVKKQPKIMDIQRVNELSIELKNISDEKDILYNKLMENESKLREYEKAQSDVSHSVQLLNDEIKQLRMLAGITPLKGKGVIITLNDSNNNRQENVDQNAFLVHAEDILSVINELNVGGAEAIEINGQRIVGRSSIRCVGSVVNINGVKVAAPFIITAIGNPDVLESSLKLPGGVIDSLAPWGIDISIKKSEEVYISGYKGSMDYELSTIYKE